MVLDRDRIKKLLMEKGVKNLDDFSTFMRDVSKDVIETLLDEELTNHQGFEKFDQKAKVIDNSRSGYTPKSVKSKFGEIGLEVPRDRKSKFEPQIVKKRKNDNSIRRIPSRVCTGRSRKSPRTRRSFQMSKLYPNWFTWL